MFLIKAFSRNAIRKKNVEGTGAASASCLKRRF
jgi:hypothetical protein